MFDITFYCFSHPNTALSNWRNGALQVAKPPRIGQHISCPRISHAIFQANNNTPTGPYHESSRSKSKECNIARFCQQGAGERLRGCVASPPRIYPAPHQRSGTPPILHRINRAKPSPRLRPASGNAPESYIRKALHGGRLVGGVRNEKALAQLRLG